MSLEEVMSMTEEGTFALNSPCKGYHLLVQRLANGFVVFPIGRLPHSGAWLHEERILAVVNQLGQGHLYLDFSRVNTVGSESLWNLSRLCRDVIKRGGRVVLGNLQSHLREFFMTDHHNAYLQLFDIQDESVPEVGVRMPDPSWLTWDDGKVRKIAEGIDETMTLMEEKATNRRSSSFDNWPIESLIGQFKYKELVSDRLLVLADALEKAGCHDDDILNHCREPRFHRPGCWVIDWLLGK
jgi:anti-anti-sigma regulatory factor